MKFSKVLKVHTTLVKKKSGHETCVCRFAWRTSGHGVHNRNHENALISLPTSFSKEFLDNAFPKIFSQFMPVLLQKGLIFHEIYLT